MEKQGRIIGVIKLLNISTASLCLLVNDKMIVVNYPKNGRVRKLQNKKLEVWRTQTKNRENFKEIQGLSWTIQK